MVVLKEIENIRSRFLKYTTAAFLKLPKIEKSRILDVGCGSGIPTLELVKLSDAEIVGVDVDQACILEFNRKISDQNLSNRVKALCLSALELNFPDESFDIVWSEGVIGEISFENTLKSCQKLIKPDGYLVIHYQVALVKDVISRLPDLGYILVETFLLPEDIWWTDFYAPLDEIIDDLYLKYNDNLDAIKLIDRMQSEIKMVKKNPSSFRSAFYIMKKTNTQSK